MESGDEEEIHMAAKDWKKMEDRMHKEGFREGIEKGKEDNLQKYFDISHEVVVAHSRRIGKLIGCICYAIDSGPTTLRLELTQLLAEVSTHLYSIPMTQIHKQANIGNFENRINCIEKEWQNSYETFQRKLDSILET